MTPEEWKRARALFDAAVERPTAERGVFLAEACGQDEALRGTVESLLHADVHARDVLQEPLPGETLVEERPEALLGCRLGDYEVVGIVGQGGMGVVYHGVRADDAFRKRVAIKLIKRGMDSAFILQRFRHEREILASLDHPNIARLMDAGTAPDGRPYFVMEFVDGQPIDRFCEEQRLDVRGRIQLFRLVCAAVASAHRNLVVHRDLKPGNILITADGTPKLLDFGLAKLLDPGAAGESTATGLFLMTPEYASPEQVRGERITTATDVYSLGVLLYELLAGRKPYTLASRHPQELLRVVCLVEPERPSAVAPRELRRALEGDLDNVALMALRKEPERRYPSVEQLSDDLLRHLQRRPVRARPDTFWYRTGRLVGRNRLASALVVALVAWVGIATYQANLARQQRARAERRFADVRRLANTFLFDFHDAIVDLPGATKARELVVKRAVEYLGALAGEAEGDPGLQRELGLAYLRLGQVMGSVGAASLGDRRAAITPLETAVTLLQRAYGARPDPALAGELADAHRRLARSLSAQVRFDEARRHLEEARRLAGLASASLGRVEDVLLQASIEQLQADWQSDRSAWSEAVLSLRSGLARLGSLPSEGRRRPDVRRQRLTLTIRLGDALGQLGRPDQSLATLDALAGDLEVPGAPLVAGEQRMLALLHAMAGSALLDLERYPDAAERLAEGRRLLEQMRRSDAANFQAAKDLTIALALLCTAEARSGRQEAAREACASGLGLVEDLTHEHPDDAGTRDALGEVCYRNGRLARDERRFAQALVFYRRVTEIVPAAGDGTAERQLASGYAGLADVLSDLGRVQEAEAEARRALEVLEAARRLAPEEPTVLKDLATAQGRLARLLHARRAEPETASRLTGSALSILESLVRDGMTLPEVHRDILQLRREVGAPSLSPSPGIRRGL